MNTNSIVEFWPKSLQKDLFQKINSFNKYALSGFANTSSKCFTLANFCKSNEIKNMFVMVNANGDLNDHINHLSLFSGLKIEELELEPNPHNDKFISKRNNLNLLNFASKIHQGNKAIFVSNYIDALSDAFDKTVFEKTLDFSKGSKLTNTQIFESLINAGYEIGDSIEVEQGQYYCRGDLIAIFPVNFDYPIRLHVEFDEITSIEILSHDFNSVIGQLEEVSIYQIQKPNSYLKHVDWLNYGDTFQLPHWDPMSNYCSLLCCT